MKESTKKYIEKKLLMFGVIKNYGMKDNPIYCFVEDIRLDDISSNLEKAIKRVSNKYGYSFNGFFIDNEDVFIETAYLKDCLPVDMTEKYGRIGKKGLYVHMLNKDFDIMDYENFVTDFLKINGEICCSEIGDEQFTTRKSKLGLILEGTPRVKFDCDCWSYTKEDGTRYATRSDSYSERSECWIVPSECKLTGIVYCGMTRKLAEKIANKFNLDLIHFKFVDGREFCDN